MFLKMDTGGMSVNKDGKILAICGIDLGTCSVMGVGWFLACSEIEIDWFLTCNKTGVG